MEQFIKCAYLKFKLWHQHTNNSVPCTKFSANAYCIHESVMLQNHRTEPYICNTDWWECTNHARQTMPLIMKLAEIKIMSNSSDNKYIT